MIVLTINILIFSVCFLKGNYTRYEDIPLEEEVIKAKLYKNSQLVKNMCKVERINKEWIFFERV